MSRLVIFDLETSERYALGQILNLAAIAVNENFEVVDKLALDVKISRTQLPSPEALLVNKVNPIEQQSKAKLNERQAITKLFEFVDKQRNDNRAGKVIVGGQNTAKFDLEFLRSNSLRSGIYPYFPKDVVYTDLIFLSKKLVVSDPSVRKILTKENGDISVSLEWLTNALGISKSKQTHDSLGDVLLTLDVFKHYIKEYDLNVFSYNSYEVDRFKPKYGDVYRVVNLENYKLVERLYALHWHDSKYALWLNVTDFDPAKGKRNLWWKTKKNSAFFTVEKVTDPNTINLAQDMLDHPDIVNVDVNSYFDVPDCDAELHVTTVKYDNMQAALDYMNNGSEVLIQHLSNRDTASYNNMLEYIKRYTMLYKKGQFPDKLFKKYCLERYSGKFKTEKNIFGEDPDYANRPNKEVYHPSLKQRLQTIEEKLVEKKDPVDQSVLLALKEYILTSEVVKTCPELLNE